MSRAQQDQYIDDEEAECCPLCVEEFDLSDRNFRPCPCGYQICQFCYNNIKTSMNGLCPACRRQYDDKNIEWKVISPEEMATYKADLAQQAKKKAAARQKEAQKREADSQSRKHLAGLRVVQKNLVYVTGLSPTIREDKLLQTLRGDQYFGQYGKISKIVVSKAKDSTHANQSVGIYVTFARKQDAAACIAAVDGSQNGDRVLRAQYGTTKYCSAYLRGETCTNRNCMFLHEPGEESESFTRQDLSSMNVISTQQPSNLQLAASGTHRSSSQRSNTLNHTSQASSQPMRKQDSKDSSTSIVEAATDIPALPSTANWANKVLSNQDDNRQPSSVSIAKGIQPNTMQEGRSGQLSGSELNFGENNAKNTEDKLSKSPPPSTEKGLHSKSSDEGLSSTSCIPHLDMMLKSLSDCHLRFMFASSKLDPEDMAIVENFPALFDLRDGAIEKIRRLKKNDFIQGQEPGTQELLSIGPGVLDEPGLESGSLQLGGEPEERQNAIYGRGLQRIIEPPAELGQTGAGANNINSAFAFNSDPANLSINGRNAIVQQQQQQQRQNLMQQLRPAVTAMSSFESLHNTQAQNAPSSIFAQNYSGGGPPGHARQASRYTFANDSASASVSVKPVSNTKFMNQQSSIVSQGTTPQLSNTPTQQGFGNQVYPNNGQALPPGLKHAGIPTHSNNNLFGQGQAFAGGGSNYGTNITGRNSNEEMVRELLRARNGIQGGNQLPDIGKHEDFPPLVPPYMLPDSQLKPDVHESLRRHSNPNVDENLSQDPTKPVVMSYPSWLWPTPDLVGQPLLSENFHHHYPASISGPLAGLGAGLQTQQVTPTNAEDSEKTASQMSSHQAVSGRSDPQTISSLKNVSDAGRSSSRDKTLKSTPHRIPESTAKDRKKLTEKSNNKNDVTTKAKGRSMEATAASSPHSAPISKRKRPDKLETTSKVEEKTSKLQSLVTLPDAKPALTQKESQFNVDASSAQVVSPVKRQTHPKTLRVLPPSKVEQLTESSMSMSSNESSQIVAGKGPSRQGSVVSINMPGTPSGDLISDQASGTSASVSRPSSPQSITRQTQTPLRAGGKKRKEKQERVSRHSTENEANSTERILSPAEEPAPIVGRKKKSKKSENAGPSQIPSSVMSSLTVEAKQQTKPEPEKLKVDDDPAKPLNNSEQKTRDSPKAELPQTAASIVSNLQATGQVVASALQFFKPAAGLSYRHELAQADLPNRDRRIKLSADDITKLNNHETVRLSGGDGRNSSRALISPSGACLRGLSKEQEDRFLELEAAVAHDKPPTKFYSNKISSFENSLPVILPTNAETAIPPPTNSHLKANDEVLAYNDQFVLQPTIHSQSSDRRGIGDHYHHPAVATSTASLLHAATGLKLQKPGEISLSSLGSTQNTILPTTSIARAPVSGGFSNGGSISNTAHASANASHGLAASAASAAHAAATAAATAAASAAAAAATASTMSGAPLLTVQEAEAAVSRSRKETESLEKKLSALIKKNKRLAFSTS